MRLYYLPGSCALAPHIALEISGASYDLVRLERGQNREAEYLAINPLGTVPALVDDRGSIVVESHAILVHIADAYPTAALAPRPGTPERDQMHRWLSYFTCTVHTGFATLWRPERFTTGDPKPVTESAEHRLNIAFALIDKHLVDRQFVLGDRLSVADHYLFVLGRWGFRLETPTSTYPNILRIVTEISSMAAVQRAMEQQKIRLDYPKSGLG